MNIRTHHAPYLIIIAILSATALWLYSKFSAASSAKADLERQSEALRLQTIADEAFIAGAKDSAFALYERLANESPIRIHDLLRQDSVQILQADKKTLLAALQRRRRELYALSNTVRKETAARRQEREQFERNIAELEARLDETNRALESKSIPIKTLRFKSAEDQESVIYVGEVIAEQANGYGIGVWASSGSVYEGPWRNNKRHGVGVHQWKNGARYEGDFVDDFRTRKGAYYWKNGDKYVGDWKEGKRHGRGAVYDKNGVLKAVGDWENDRLVKKDSL